MTLRSLLPKPSGFEILTVIMILIVFAVAFGDWDRPVTSTYSTAHTHPDTSTAHIGLSSPCE